MSLTNHEAGDAVGEGKEREVAWGCPAPGIPAPAERPHPPSPTPWPPPAGRPPPAGQPPPPPRAACILCPDALLGFASAAGNAPLLNSRL